MHYILIIWVSITQPMPDYPAATGQIVSHKEYPSHASCQAALNKNISNKLQQCIPATTDVLNWFKKKN